MLKPLTQVACPVCGVGNRVAERGAVVGAKCGKCGVSLFPASPLNVDDESFAHHLSLTKGAVLVDVWANWCAPCRAMAPQYAAAARALQGDVVFLKMNADDCATPAKLGVRGIPAFVLFKDGKEVARQAGLMSAGGLVSWVQNALAQGRGA